MEGRVQLENRTEQIIAMERKLLQLKEATD